MKKTTIDIHDLEKSLVYFFSVINTAIKNEKLLP